MNTFGVLVFTSLVLVSGASASMIPSNITIDFNLGFGTGDDQKNNEAEREDNNTYGERVDGQSVYSETGPNNPPERRNSEEYGITEENPKADDDVFSQVMQKLQRIFS
jgi:hypothetical protein